MQKLNSRCGVWWRAAFFLAALAVVPADQLSKIWIRSYPQGQAIFDAGFFRIIHFPPHTGAAFGLFGGQNFLLAIVALVGVALLLFYIFFLHRRYPFLDSITGRLALGLVLGGIVGNLIDRLRFGGVTDFIDFGFWPAFNIADSAVVVGAILLAYSLIRPAK